MAEEKKEVKKPVKKGVDIEKWIARKLKAVNEMKDEAKAKAIAERIMKIKRG